MMCAIQSVATGHVRLHSVILLCDFLGVQTHLAYTRAVALHSTARKKESKGLSQTPVTPLSPGGVKQRIKQGPLTQRLILRQPAHRAPRRIILGGTSRQLAHSTSTFLAFYSMCNLHFPTKPPPPSPLLFHSCRYSLVSTEYVVLEVPEGDRS